MATAPCYAGLYCKHWFAAAPQFGSIIWSAPFCWSHVQQIETWWRQGLEHMHAACTSCIGAVTTATCEGKWCMEQLHAIASGQEAPANYKRHRWHLGPQFIAPPRMGTKAPGGVARVYGRKGYIVTPAVRTALVCYCRRTMHACFPRCSMHRLPSRR